MNVAMAAVTASTVVGLIVAPVTRRASWRRLTRALLVLCSVSLGVLALQLAIADDRAAGSGALALGVLAMAGAFWLSRSPGGPPSAADGDAEDDAGGGGGGPRKPPEDPPPAPPSPGLDWDAFDEERERWAATQPAAR